MAFGDYGAILRVDGKFINKDKGLFMQASDTGYVCKKALHKDRKEYDIDGNYFVYAGDKDFLVVFYKGTYKVISNEKVIHYGWNVCGDSETFYLDNLPNLKVSVLSKKYELRLFDWLDEESIREDYKWYIERKGKKFADRWLRRRYKAKYMTTRGHGGFAWNTRPYRFLAEWDYNGHHYEVIYGMGIDPNEKVWNDIKNEYYKFRKDEIELIDSWFNGD